MHTSEPCTRLPWPRLASRPEGSVTTSAVALYGPGIMLFGKDITDSLQCDAESTDGVQAPQLSDIVVACGGAAKWHAFVAGCVKKVNTQPGGLLFNWFKLGTAGGTAANKAF